MKIIIIIIIIIINKKQNHYYHKLVQKKKTCTSEDEGFLLKRKWESKPIRRKAKNKETKLCKIKSHLLGLSEKEETEKSLS